MNPLSPPANWPLLPYSAERSKFLRQVAQFTKPEHLAILQREVDAGCRRIRPEEVLGACAVVELPASFEATRPHAEEILLRV